MRFTPALILFGAVTAISAQTEFNVPSAGECIDTCNQKGAADILPNFSADPKNSNFLASLDLMCTKGGSYTKFMMNAGMCMSACTKEEQTAFNEYHTKACEWYQANKDATPSATGSSALPSSTPAVSPSVSSQSPSVSSQSPSVSSQSSSSVSQSVSNGSSTGSTSTSASVTPNATNNPASNASDLKHNALMLLGGAALALLSIC